MDNSDLSMSPPPPPVPSETPPPPPPVFTMFKTIQTMHSNNNNNDNNEMEKECTEDKIKWPFDDSKTWDAFIELTSIKKTFENAQEVDEFLTKCNNISTSTQKTTFTTFTRFFEDAPTQFFSKSDQKHFLSHTFPSIIKLAIQSKSIFQNTETAQPKLLLQQKQSTNKISRVGCASILSCAFLMLFPDQGHDGRQRHQLKPLSFKPFWFGCELTTMLCLLTYFKRVCDKFEKGTLGIARKHVPTELTFERVVLTDKFDWKEQTKTSLCSILVEPKKSMEESTQPFHVNFANSQFCGLVFAGGRLQEEILFMIKPELFVGVLFSTTMKSNESIIVSGARQFSKYTGYAASFRFNGKFESKKTTPATIISIDSSHFAWSGFRNAYGNVNDPDPTSESEKETINPTILRDLYKAYIGFSVAKQSSIATGNWGTGAFGWNKYVKFILQWISASQANVSLLHYHAFDDQSGLASKIQTFVEKISNFSKKTGKQIHVSELYKAFAEKNSIISETNDFSCLDEILFK